MNGLKLLMDGNTLVSFTSVSNFTAVHSAYLMSYANNASGAVGAKFTGNVYKCRLYDNGVLVRNFVPCKRTSDSVVGMYDTVNDVFYTNAGTGDFTAGGNVT